MVSALSLAKQGFKAYLVEKENELGGIARKLHFTLEGNNPQDFLTDLIRQIYGDPLIQVYTQALVKEISGWVGNFSTKILLNTSGEEHEIKHGVIVVASGGEEYKPKDYLYGKDPRVMTLLELEKAISQGEPKLKDCSTLVMILCVGSRDEERPYCSRVCCSQAIKCALKLNEINKDMGIYILNRDIVTYGLKEIYYQEARNRGVIFVRFDPEDKPEVNISEEGILRVLVKDATLGKRLAIDTDILALGTAVIPASGNKDLASMLKVPLDRDGFFLEAHIKLRPVDFANDGIFMCGLCHSPKHIEESIVQAQAAASRASTILSQKEITTSGVIAYIDEEKCFGCGICESLCPFNAIRMKQVNKKRKAEVIPVSCKGCGICVPRCPRSAITIGGFTDEEILSEIDALAKV
jgi:heterodisulfide reductase subunit A